MHKYSIYNKGIAVIIALLFLFTTFPIIVFAQNSEDRNIDVETKAIVANNSNYFTSPASAEKDIPESSGEQNLSSRAVSISSGVYAIAKQNTTSYARCNTVNGGT